MPWYVAFKEFESGSRKWLIKRPPVNHLAMTDAFSSSAFELMTRFIGFSSVLVKSGLFVAGKTTLWSCASLGDGCLSYSSPRPTSRKPLDTQRAVSNLPWPSYRTSRAKVENCLAVYMATSKAQVAKLAVR